MGLKEHQHFTLGMEVPEGKIVIPLRHPAKIAARWAFNRAAGIPPKPGLETWHKSWRAMSSLRVDGFYFPLETMPVDELEAYLGREVNLVTRKVGAASPPDVEKLLTVDDWKIIYDILEGDRIARKYYGI